MSDQKHTPGAVRAARMIYLTHKAESTTMPCFGSATEEYIQNIAGMIDQETELPFFTAKNEHLHDKIDRLKAKNSQLRDLLRNLYVLVDDGALVRDVSRDGEPGWHLEMVRLVKILADTRAAIEPVEQEKRGDHV